MPAAVAVISAVVRRSAADVDILFRLVLVTDIIPENSDVLRHHSRLFLSDLRIVFQNKQLIQFQRTRRTYLLLR